MKENTFIINKEFKTEELNIKGYDISSISKARALNENFKASCKFDFDPQHLADVIGNKGKVYTYRTKGGIVALYVVSREGNTYTCNETYHASDLSEDIIEKMDKQVAFLVAQSASVSKDGKAIFKGVDLPKLSSKTGKYNWLMGLAMCLSFGTMFCVAMKTPAGIGVGIAMGIAMGLCFTESFYFYEGAVTEEAKTAEA